MRFFINGLRVLWPFVASASFFMVVAVVADGGDAALGVDSLVELNGRSFEVADVWDPSGRAAVMNDPAITVTVRQPPRYGPGLQWLEGNLVWGACNDVSGTLALTHDTWRVEPLFTTYMDCHRGDAQEKWMTSFLASSPHWSDEGDADIVLESDGTRVLLNEVDRER